MTPQALYDELDIWAAEGWAASFWWRDDDLEAESDGLSKLLDLSWRLDIPVMLAVVPADCSDGLPEALAGSKSVVALHGYRHRSHAGPGEKKSELSEARSIEDRMDDLTRGHEKLSELFADMYCGTLVPPWNRVGADLIPRLPEMGIHGLSTFAPRLSPEPVPGLIQSNTHVDMIDWRGSRDYVGDDQMIEKIVGHIQAKRKGTVDVDEPTGLLSHHLVTSEAGWQGLESILNLLAAHTAVRFEHPADLFPDPPKDI